MEPANIRIQQRCGFRVQNPSDSDADADLLHDQNYQMFLATAIQLSY